MKSFSALFSIFIFGLIAYGDLPSTHDIIETLKKYPVSDQVIKDAEDRALKITGKKLEDIVGFCEIGSSENGNGVVELGYTQIAGITAPVSRDQNEYSDTVQFNLDPSVTEGQYTTKIYDSLRERGEWIPQIFDYARDRDFLIMQYLAPDAIICIRKGVPLNLAIPALVHELTHFAYLSPFEVVDPLKSETPMDFLKQVMTLKGEEFDAYRTHISFQRKNNLYDDKDTVIAATKNFFSDNGDLDPLKKDDLLDFILLPPPKGLGYANRIKTYFGWSAYETVMRRSADLDFLIDLENYKAANVSEDNPFYKLHKESMERMRKLKEDGDLRLTQLDAKAKAFGLGNLIGVLAYEDPEGPVGPVSPLPKGLGQKKVASHFPELGYEDLITKVTDDNFVIVEVFVPDCTACDQMDKILEAYSKKNPKNKIYRINKRSSPEVESELGVSGVPAIVMFANPAVSTNTVLNGFGRLDDQMVFSEIEKNKIKLRQALGIHR